mmetsp:Transcript_74059/g.173882  ORF Transcript_74059/g.173882 Transcript_74059/m.173882 type:complete len:221 (+) Transcript_74059:115-777(+)
MRKPTKVATGPLDCSMAICSVGPTDCGNRTSVGAKQVARLVGLILFSSDFSSTCSRRRQRRVRWASCPGAVCLMASNITVSASASVAPSTRLVPATMTCRKSMRPSGSSRRKSLMRAAKTWGSVDMGRGSPPLSMASRSLSTSTLLPGTRNRPSAASALCILWRWEHNTSSGHAIAVWPCNQLGGDPAIMSSGTPNTPNSFLSPCESPLSFRPNFHHPPA